MMPERIVASVLNVGDFRGRTYSPLWVQRLRNMVARHLSGHRFVCLSNVEIEGVETIPLQDSLPGWWSKLELFRPGLFPGSSRVLYIDLDVVIVGELEPLFEHPGALVAMRAPHRGKTSYEGEKRVTKGLNSGTLAWTPGEQTEALYTAFHPRFIKELRGDQDWITEQVSKPAFFPKEWFCRLQHCPKGPPEECRIVHVMPWKNDVAVHKFAWVRKRWV